ncbi:DUF551 domain-containing protein [Enterobacter roggenkampii]|uniref:DUF551 domain-containing protein n=1 Tax=Enterobacter roggenkampii TaxID=1812935 RepID=UPI0022E0C50C|nr:DUF551 domain-containing protein [Enterobacter roggenkampii]
MSTTLKEWLVKTIMELEEERDAVPGAVNEDAAMALAAMKIALASLEAEAVADVVAWSSPNEERTCDIRMRRHDIKPGSLYTAPPAPEFYKIGDATMRHIFTPTGITDVSDMQAVFDQIETVLAGMWQPAPVSVPDGYRLQPISEYDAMCAAMLQGSEPVMTAYKLPECWVACSERMPDDEEDVLCFGQYGDNDIDEERYQFMGWLSSKGIKRVWRVSDGDSQNRRARVTHWMPLPAAPQREGENV